MKLTLQDATKSELIKLFNNHLKENMYSENEMNKIISNLYFMRLTDISEQVQYLLEKQKGLTGKDFCVVQEKISSLFRNNEQLSKEWNE